jgi:hypothetical protein
MFSLALFFGIYSYTLFFLGIAGLLYKNVIIILTILALMLLIIHKRSPILAYAKTHPINTIKKSLFAQNNKKILLLLLILIIQVLVNLIGVIGPELGFDALWYHLTLPKLYLLHHAVYHVPGGLLYYSDMPKLGELLYVGALSFGNEIVAKFTQFFFGIFIAIILYQFARKYFSTFISLVAVVLFYSNIIVAWESTTAYVDLIRTFFEILALWSFIKWKKHEQLKWFVLSAIMTGLAITSKFLAFGSLAVFLLLIFYPFDKKRLAGNVLYAATYCLIAVFIPLPWLIFSFIHTGNPFYPFFSQIYQISPEPLSITGFISDVWNIFVNAPDPISPMYVILLPLLIWCFPNIKKEIRILVYYAGLSVIVWYFTPRTGGGRFLLPYVPAYSLVAAAVIDQLTNHKKNYKSFFTKYVMILIVITSLITIGYRSAAEKKYIPLLLGKETKANFLQNNLNFAYGDFYDIDDFIKNQTKSKQTVLLYGFHNLYYIDFPFIDSSWVKEGDKFSYIAVQNGKLPERFGNWQLVYSNDKTMVKLYRNKSSETITY